MAGDPPEGGPVCGEVRQGRARPSPFRRLPASLGAWEGLVRGGWTPPEGVPPPAPCPSHVGVLTSRAASSACFPAGGLRSGPGTGGSCAVWSHPRNPRLTGPGATPHRARSLLLAGPAASLRCCGVHGLPGARRQAMQQSDDPGGDGFRRAFQGPAGDVWARCDRHAGYGDRPG